jgi:hypothetical protein
LDGNGKYIEFAEGTNDNQKKNFDDAVNRVKFMHDWGCDWYGLYDSYKEIATSPIKATVYTDSDSKFGSFGFDPKAITTGTTNTIWGSDNKGYELSDGGKQSPGNGLWHEFGHFIFILKILMNIIII